MKEIELKQTIRVEVKVDDKVVEILECVIQDTKTLVLFRNKVAREMLKYEVPKKYWFNQI